MFDYVDGGAEREISLRRARERYDDVEFLPKVLRDVSKVDTSAMLLGSAVDLPLICAPTGFTRMMHWTGEKAVARAASAARVPYALSTMGTTTIEEVAAATPEGVNWFQLYVGPDRDRVGSLIRRAADAGFSALVVTVDAPVAGSRTRDLRNGLTIPPSLSLRTLADIARHPRWWSNVLTRDPLRLVTLDRDDWSRSDTMTRILDPAFDQNDLARLRDAWAGPLVVKGVQCLEDAAAVVAIGADAVVLSNHGGRQLDRTRNPLDLVAEVAAELNGSAEVYVDGGVQSGADIAAALALGADAVLVGRAYLYGLMADGEAGVTRAIEILRSELARTLQLLGVARIDELTPDHIHLPAT